MRIKTRRHRRSSYYVDGGFVQVADNVVAVLTNRAVPAEELGRGRGGDASSARPCSGRPTRRSCWRFAIGRSLRPARSYERRGGRGCNSARRLACCEFSRDLSRWAYSALARRPMNLVGRQLRARRQFAQRAATEPKAEMDAPIFRLDRHSLPSPHSLPGRAAGVAGNHAGPRPAADPARQVPRVSDRRRQRLRPGAGRFAVSRGLRLPVRERQRSDDPPLGIGAGPRGLR